MFDNIIIGFTGTQVGMTDAQKREVNAILADKKSQSIGINCAIHGDCIGADSEFHTMATNLQYQTIAYPASDVDKRKVANCQCSFKNPPRPALTRNHDIVGVANLMVACPKEMSEIIRSGTWATIRYARSIKTPLIIVFPDGSIQKENVYGTKNTTKSI